MNKFVPLMVSLFLAVSTQAHAGDLGWAGALSGAGKAMGDSLATYQSMLLQRQLLEERDRMEREREERAYQRQQERERAERLNAEQAERAGYERARAEYLQLLEANRRPTEYQQLMTEDQQTAPAKLLQRHPDWEAVVGPKDSQTPFRTWLATQPAAYQRIILGSWDPNEIGESIDRFKAETQR